MDGSSTDSKVNLLFKEANNTVDVVRYEPFTNPQNAYPFQNYVQNDEIFSNDIPKDLSNISYQLGSTTYYGCQALDLSLSLAGQVDPSSIPIPGQPDLVYHYRLPLTKASTQIFGTAPKRTWYVPDPSNSSRSILADAIAYNYDAVYNSYMPSLVDMCGNNQNPYYSPNVGAIWWRMDYKSGFVQLYGTDGSVDAFVPSALPADAPRLSFIQYVGPKGAGTGGLSNGGDASFNNVDISDSLTVKHLTVTETAQLPEDTLIYPKWDGVEGSHSNVPQFPAGYPKTEQVVNYEVDPTVNPVTDQDWVTIAYCQEDTSGLSSSKYYSDGRADGVFKITYPRSSAHSTITFHASIKYGRGTGINVVQHDWYTGTGNFDAIRIMSQGTYDGAALQVRFRNLPASGGAAYTVRLWDNYDYPGWTIYSDTSGVTSAGIPVVVSDNNPESHFDRFDPSNVNIGKVAYTSQYLVDELTWNTTNTYANQVTGNQALFHSRVRIDDRLDVNGPLHANDGVITNELTTETMIVGQTPNSIVDSTSTFYLDGSVVSGDWITIARVGETQTTALSNIRHSAYGTITVFDHHANKFQCVAILAGVMVSEGCVLEAVNTGLLTPNITHIWKAARIVLAEEYDGAILQLQVGPAVVTGSSYPYRVALTDGRSYPGWRLSDGTLSDDSSPAIYAGSKVAQGYGYSQYNTNWPTIPLNYAPVYSPDRRAEAGKITAIPHRFEKARVMVYGENIFCQKDLAAGFGGTLGSVDGLIYVESSQHGGSYLSLGMDPNNGNVKLSNNNGNSTPYDLYLDGEGSIILDNQSTQSSGAANAGIVLLSNDGVFVDCKSSGGNGNVTFRFGQAPNQELIFLKSSGLDMNQHDISNIDTTYTNALSTNGIDFNPRTNNANMPVGSMGGFLTGERVTMECPLRLWANASANNALAQSTYANGTTAYHTNTHKVLVRANNLVRTVAFEEDIEIPWWDWGYVALGLRHSTGASATRTFTTTRTFLQHFYASESILFNLDTASHGYFVKGHLHTTHRAVTINRVKLRTFNNYARIIANISQALDVDFEVWIAVTSQDDWSFNQNTGSGGMTVPNDVINGTTSSTTARRLNLKSMTVLQTTSTQFMYNPFTSGTGSATDLDVTLSSPLTVPVGSHVAVYCVERCLLIPQAGSGSTIQLEQYRNGDNWSNASVCMKVEMFGYY